MAGPMLAWLGRHEAGHLRRARWALQAKDWLRLQLTGEVHTEPSDASATLLYDLTKETWDRDVIDAIGVDPRILPDLLPSSFAPAGRLTPESAALLDVPTGTPVAAGAADTAAALLGTGLAAPGSVQLTIGTGIQVVSPFEELAAGLSSTPVTHTYRTAHPSGWYAMAAMLNGGSTLAWVRQILGLSWSELYDCAGLPPAVDDPTFLPHLHGERTPWLDTSLRGSWTDLNPRHDRLRLARAALEGVAITVKTGFECLHPPSTVSTRSSVPVRLAGGGTVSPAWRQMLADAIGRPLEAVEANAASGRGAALLGGVSAEEIPRLPPRTAPGERVATPSRRGVDLFDARAALARERLRSLSRSP
jgi:xylulokinase